MTAGTGSLSATGKAAASYTSSYVANKVTGIETHFSWAGLAASSLPSIMPPLSQGLAPNEFFIGRFMQSAYSGALGSTSQRLLNGGGTQNWGAVATNAFGTTLGNSLADKDDWTAKGKNLRAGLETFGKGKTEAVNVGGEKRTGLPDQQSQSNTKKNPFELSNDGIQLASNASLSGTFEEIKDGLGFLNENPDASVKDAIQFMKRDKNKISDSPLPEPLIRIDKGFLPIDEDGFMIASPEQASNLRSFEGELFLSDLTNDDLAALRGKRASVSVEGAIKYRDVGVSFSSDSKIKISTGDILEFSSSSEKPTDIETKANVGKASAASSGEVSLKAVLPVIGRPTLEASHNGQFTTISLGAGYTNKSGSVEAAVTAKSEYSVDRMIVSNVNYLQALDRSIVNNQLEIDRHEGRITEMKDLRNLFFGTGK